MYSLLVVVRAGIILLCLLAFFAVVLSSCEIVLEAVIRFLGPSLSGLLGCFALCFLWFGGFLCWDHVSLACLGQIVLQFYFSCHLCTFWFALSLLWWRVGAIRG